MTLQEILLDSSSVLDLSASLPTGDELTLRTNYANQAIEDATAANQFPEFSRTYNIPVTNTYIITLPSGFRELERSPMGLSSGGWVEFPEILEEDKFGNSDNYCYITGDPKNGYFATFNGLTTNMSLSIQFQAYPAIMATLTDVCELSDASYVTRKIESYVLYSRGDDRFQVAEARANNILLNMIGRKSKTPGGQGQDTRARFKNPLA